jgi:hypothetical protein
MTIALGDMPGVRPVDTGIVFGDYDYDPGHEITFNNTVAQRSMFYDQHGFTIDILNYRAAVKIIVETIWRTPDNIWSCVDWGIHLNTTDVRGIQNFQARCPLHLGLEWTPSSCVGMYLLDPGSYTVWPWFFSSPLGYNQICFTSTYMVCYAHKLGEGRAS